MSETITFYGHPFSRARVVHWMLEEIGAPYDFKLLDLEKGEHKMPEYLRINPMGKVPAIVHRGVVVTESAAILAYLADAFPQAKMAPAVDDARRGTYLRWLFFGAGCVEPAMIDKSFQRPPVERPSTQGYGTYDDVLRALETAVTPGPYVCGEQITAADIYLGAQINWGLQTKSIEARPAFVAFAERVTSRPAYARANAQATAMLPPRSPK
jgi:glutathione S-transferase